MPSIRAQHPTYRPQFVESSDVPRTYGFLLLLLAAVLLVNSALGPLLSGVVEYPITESLENQLIGLELVSVFLVAPWAALAGLAALRGHPAAPFFGLAPAAYTAYMFAQYVLGPEYTHYSITVLAQLGIFVLSSALMAMSWSMTRELDLPPLPRATAVRSAWLLFALAAFVLLRYAESIAGSFTAAPIADEYVVQRTFFWSIYLLDLGLVVPCAVAAGVALMRGTSTGQRALYAVVGWFALVPPSVAAMALVMWVRDDPFASLPTVGLLSIASLAFGALAWHTLRPLLASEGTPVSHLPESTQKAGKDR